MPDPGKRIKIVWITPTLECGGAERYVSLCCNNFDTSRFAITLVVLDNAHPFYSIDNPDISLVNLGIRHARNALVPLRRLLAREKPDLVYSVANHVNLLLATFRWLFPKNIFFLARESSIVSFNSRRARWPELYTRLVKKFYRRLDFIICQSDYMQQDLVQHFSVEAGKTAVINNPVWVQESTDLPTAAASPRFITVARLSEEKGIGRLLEAVARLSFPFRYYITGEGKERGRLEEKIRQLGLQDRVFLTGEKINPFYKQEDASLFLMGSYYEGFPNVVAEAGMLGIPVLAFEAPGGIKEMIREGVNGMLVKEQDPAAFAKAVETALAMNFDRPAIIEMTKSRYGIDKIIPATENLIISLLAGKLRPDN